MLRSPGGARRSQVGNPKNPNATGSPVSAQCSKSSWGQDCGVMGGAECCISHTMGFTGMVEPAVAFVLNVTSAAR